MRLENKVALVTGGASGIGEAICRRFAQENAKVVITDIQQEKGEELARQIIDQGGQAEFLNQDVSDPAQWQQVIDATIGRYGKLDILVNNAGLVIPNSVEDCTLEEWQTQQKVNNDGVFLGTQAAIKVMKGQGDGSIINISSIDGILGEPAAVAYNASKGAVRLLSKSAALHCAEQGYNIRVNSVHPGYIETPLVAGALASWTEEQAQAFAARTIHKIPVQRMGQPMDIANGVLYLASDESSYVTGSELVIDGGYTAQ